MLNEKIIDLLFELKEKMVKENEFEFWLYLNKSEKLMNELKQENNGLIEENTAIKGKIFLGKNSVIKSGSRIEGNVFVGENCVIGPNAFIRNGTIIANNVFVGSSEVKNSIILSNSKIPHYSYVGDSIIGDNVNFGAGAKIANLRFDEKNIKVKINKTLIDSKRRKLGALIGNNTRIGINSSINCGVIIPKNSLIKPNELVK